MRDLHTFPDSLRDRREIERRERLNAMSAAECRVLADDWFLFIQALKDVPPSPEAWWKDDDSRKWDAALRAEIAFAEEEMAFWLDQADSIDLE